MTAFDLLGRVYNDLALFRNRSHYFVVLFFYSVPEIVIFVSDILAVIRFHLFEVIGIIYRLGFLVRRTVTALLITDELPRVIILGNRRYHA